MQSNELTNFTESRVQIRAYLTYLLERNIPTSLPSISLENIMIGAKSIRKEADFVEAIYVLDAMGEQISDTISPTKALRRHDKGVNRSHRAYYYNAVRQKRAILTDPYPSLLTNKLTVSASMPVYNDRKQLQYIVVIDVALKDVVKILYPSLIGRFFVNFNKVAYAMISAVLLGVSFLLLAKGVGSLIASGSSVLDMDLKHIFESTILLTLALAIFDLVKTIFEEEVLGRQRRSSNIQNKTMTKFIGSIIIALAIEALMLVFKSALTDPTQLIYAMYIVGGVAVLIFALAYYIKQTQEKIINNDEKV
jgi:hypothetical protein